MLSEAKAKVIAGLRREQQELTKAEKLLAKAASVSGVRPGWGWREGRSGPACREYWRAAWAK